MTLWLPGAAWPRRPGPSRSLAQCYRDLDVKLSTATSSARSCRRSSWRSGCSRSSSAIQPMLDQAQLLLAKGVDLADRRVPPADPAAAGARPHHPDGLPAGAPDGPRPALRRPRGGGAAGLRRQPAAAPAAGPPPGASVAGLADMYVLMQLVPDSNQRFRGGDRSGSSRARARRHQARACSTRASRARSCTSASERPARAAGRACILADTSAARPPGRDARRARAPRARPGRAPGRHRAAGRRPSGTSRARTTGVYDMARATGPAVRGPGRVGLRRRHLIVQPRQPRDDASPSCGRRRRESAPSRISPHTEIMQRHQMFSFPVACLVFAVLGLALGLHTRKEGKLGGFTLGIAVHLRLLRPHGALREPDEGRQLPRRLGPLDAQHRPRRRSGCGRSGGAHASGGRELAIRLPAWLRGDAVPPIDRRAGRRRGRARASSSGSRISDFPARGCSISTSPPLPERRRAVVLRAARPLLHRHVHRQVRAALQGPGGRLDAGSVLLLLDAAVRRLHRRRWRFSSRCSPRSAA